MTPTSPYTVCRAKGGPETCSRHKHLYAAERDLEKLTREIQKVAPTQQKLDRYLHLRNEIDKYRTLIGVSEYNDMEIAAATIDTELQAEMKKLLSKRVDRIDVTQIPWGAYVKAAVTFLNAQSYGSKIEALYRRKHGYQKIKASESRGDALNPRTNETYEIKFSAYGSPDRQVDLVQIRPHHDLSAYHVLTFDKDSGETEFYMLTKDEMAQELIATGHTLAHGTNASRGVLTNAEYAIRFKKDSDVYNRWQRYRKPLTWQ